MKGAGGGPRSGPSPSKKAQNAGGGPEFGPPPTPERNY